MADQTKEGLRAYSERMAATYRAMLNHKGDTFVLPDEGTGIDVLTREEVKNRLRIHDDFLHSLPQGAHRVCEEILRRPYHWCTYRSEDGLWASQILELPGCLAGGETPEDALTQLRQAAKSWVLTALGEGMDIPVPHEGRKELRPFHQGHLDEAEDAASLKAYKDARTRLNSLLRSLDETIYTLTPSIDPEAHPELFTVRVAPDK